MDTTPFSNSDPAETAPAPPGDGDPASTQSPDAGGPRRLFVVAVLSAILGLGITLSFGYADHDPHPHDVRIAVAAPAGVAARVQAGLQQAAPGGFRVIAVSGAGAATRAVRSQSALAALIVPASASNTVVTAGAEGLTEQQALTKALTAASSAMHRSARPLDVAPLQAATRPGCRASCSAWDC